MYGQEIHNIQLNYTMQFWDAYKDNRKFFRTHFSENHEFLGIGAKYLDHDLANFIKEFESKGYMKDTIVTIISDHGSHHFSAHFPNLPDNSRGIENFLPFLFHILPKEIDQNLKSILSQNEQSFISSYDIYTTLKIIASNQSAKARDAVSYSYFHKVIPSSHDCSNRTEYFEA